MTHFAVIDGVRAPRGPRLGRGLRARLRSAPRAGAGARARRGGAPRPLRRRRTAGASGPPRSPAGCGTTPAPASTCPPPATGPRWAPVTTVRRPIHAVLARRGAFLRKAAGETTEAQVVAANVDVALIATALPADLSERRIERYLALAWESGAVPVVVLTKADLAEDVDAAVRAVRAVAPGADVVAVSSVSGAGVDALARWLRPGRTAVLLGSSGVGKSTLANRLMGGRGAADRRRARRRQGPAHHHAPPAGAAGRRRAAHRHAGDARAAAVDGGCGPGCRLCGRGGARRPLPLRRLRARAEPGCAVRAAAQSGALDPERLESWHRLRRELAWLATRQDEAAAAQEKARVRTIHRAQRAHHRSEIRVMEDATRPPGFRA